MPLISVPFAIYQRVVIPAGSSQMKNGKHQVTEKDMTVTVVSVLQGYMEIVDGALVFHPPMLLATCKGQSASYEVTNSILFANDLSHLAAVEVNESVTA